MSHSTEAAPLPSPPFCDVQGISNFRDIGGYACSDSSSIRKGLAYRCADPSRVQPAGLEKMKELGIAKIFDLRSVPELQRKGPEWAGVEITPDAFVTASVEQQVPKGAIERVWCPVFREEDYSPDKIALRYRNYARTGTDGFVAAYKDILAHGREAYTTILTHLAQPSPEPCVFHCTAGKDRTGVLTAIMYLLCGVDRETIAKEYALTDEGLKDLKPLFRERLLMNPALEGDEAGVDNMISSKAANMLATIDMLEQTYGNAERYVTEELGFSNARVEQLKKNLIAKTPPTL